MPGMGVASLGSGRGPGGSVWEEHWELFRERYRDGVELLPREAECVGGGL